MLLSSKRMHLAPPFAMPSFVRISCPVCALFIRQYARCSPEVSLLLYLQPLPFLAQSILVSLERCQPCLHRHSTSSDNKFHQETRSSTAGKIIRKGTAVSLLHTRAECTSVSTTGTTPLNAIITKFTSIDVLALRASSSSTYSSGARRPSGCVAELGLGKLPLAAGGSGSGSRFLAACQMQPV